MTKRYSIKDWAEDDKPREKLMHKGAASLSSAELLAILIGQGSAKEDAVSLCQRILQHYDNDLRKVSRASVDEFCQFSGIGPAKAVTIVAALELSRRRQLSDAKPEAAITDSRSAYRHLYPYMEDLNHEEFKALLLNRANRIIKILHLGRGNVSETVVDTMALFEQAILSKASGIILCHNHPSGQTKPSKEDMALTKQIADAAKLFKIKVLDHLIIGKQAYFSFADEGKMP